MTKFSDLLMNFRRRSYLKQKDIAKELDVSISFICQIEKGVRPPSYALCEKLASMLNLSDREKHEFFLSAFEARYFSGPDKEFFNVFLDHAKLQYREEKWKDDIDDAKEEAVNSNRILKKINEIKEEISIINKKNKTIDALVKLCIEKKVFSKDELNNILN